MYITAQLKNVHSPPADMHLMRENPRSEDIHDNIQYSIPSYFVFFLRHAPLSLAIPQRNELPFFSSYHANYCTISHIEIVHKNVADITVKHTVLGTLRIQKSAQN